MKIREFSASNYRPFRDEHNFTLSDRFTVIAGINGRGKTAILDGLALLISRLLRSLDLSEGDQRTIGVDDIHGEASVARLAMNVNCANTPVRFEISRARDQDRCSSTRLPAAVRERIVNGYGDATRPDDQAPVAAYYTTDRARFRLPRELPRDLPQGQRAAYRGALVNRTVDYRDLMARYRLWAGERQNKVLIAFNDALGIFLDGFRDVQINEEPLRLTVQKEDHRLQLGQLSDGERAFIAVIGDLIRRLALANPELQNPLQGHGVVLIDELELHLHPKWQREVCEKLRETFPNIQFIATTHSPFVIQSLRPGELINLDPEEFGEYADRSIEDIAEHVMGIEIPQKSERYLEMFSTAEAYYRLLQDPDAIAADVDRAEERLNELATRFSDDPAFQALLKLERESKHRGDDDATG